MQSKALTVADYLAEIPEEQRTALKAVRAVIRKNLPAGYVERMNWGMISYEVPLAFFPETYNGQPLNYAALAAQKNHCSLYLSCLYMGSEWEKKLRAAFQAAGLKLNMGKCCIRFKTAADLPLDTIGELVTRMTPAEFVEFYQQARASGRRC